MFTVGGKSHVCRLKYRVVDARWHSNRLSALVIKANINFVSELFDGTPLRVGLNGLQVELNSTRAVADSSVFFF